MSQLLSFINLYLFCNTSTHVGMFKELGTNVHHIVVLPLALFTVEPRHTLFCTATVPFLSCTTVGFFSLTASLGTALITVCSSHTQFKEAKTTPDTMIETMYSAQEPLTLAESQGHSAGSNVTVFHYCSITLQPLEGFSNNL